MTRLLTPFWKASACLGLAACLVVLSASPADAGLFNRRRDVIVVAPTTTYVVADPVVMSRTIVAERMVTIPTTRVYSAPVETVVRVPARRVYSTPVETVVRVPARRIYATQAVEDVMVVPTSRVYTTEVIRPTRVYVPSSTIIEYSPY